MKAAETGGFCVMGCMAIFWSALTLTADVFLMIAIQKQVATLNYSSTTGTITKSGVKSGASAKGGRTHSLDMGYTYSVKGQTFDGTNYRSTEMGSNDGWARKYSSTHPVGTVVTVYYDP